MFLGWKGFGLATEVASPTTAATAACATASAAAATTTAAIIARVAARSVKAASATTAAWSAFFARASFVNGQRTAVEIFPVELGDCGLGVRIGAHGDKGEPA